MPHSHDAPSDAARAAATLAEALAIRPTERLVLAESCTAGLVAALLGQHPGISTSLCGSAVTYRASVKQQWIGVSAATLAEHTAESHQTTDEMAIGVLQATDEATIAAAITGHLGPNAPDRLDGRVFVSIARRNFGTIELTCSETFQLAATDRISRQSESAKCVLELLLTHLPRLM